LREAAIESRIVKDELLSQQSGLEKEEEKGTRQYHESRLASAFGTKLAKLEVKVEGTSHIHILDADTPKELGRQLNRVVRVQRKDRNVEKKRKRKSGGHIQHIFGLLKMARETAFTQTIS